MKTLIVFYSRSGVTRKACQELAGHLGADVEEIIDKTDRSGVIGWLKGGHDATFLKTTEIEPTKTDPAAYDLVVIGTPIWAFTMAPAVRSYLAANKGKFRRVAFLATMGGSGEHRTFKHMQELAGLTPAAAIALREKQVRGGEASGAIQEFAQALAKGI
jgi:flavodoxin